MNYILDWLKVAHRLGISVPFVKTLWYALAKDWIVDLGTRVQVLVEDI